MAALPHDGEIRHTIRNFTLNPRVQQRARSVKDLAEGIGFDVVECDLPKGMNGRLSQDAWSENGYSIEINRSLSVEAKRFAVLHEMGHYFLHTDNNDPLADIMHFDLSGDTFYLDQNLEREANAFAEAILFGGGQLAAAVGLHGSDLVKLAKYFGVTQPVVRIAIEKLR